MYNGVLACVSFFYSFVDSHILTSIFVVVVLCHNAMQIHDNSFVGKPFVVHLSNKKLPEKYPYMEHYW